MSRRSNHRTKSAGQSLVEFGLVLPVFLLLVLVAVDFGRLYFTTIQLSNAVREAANYGASQPDDPGGMLARANTERNAQSQTGQQDVLAYPANLSTSCANPGGTPISCADAPGGPGAGNTLSVTLDVPFQFITPLIGNFFGDSLNITTSATVAVIGLAPDPTESNPDDCDNPDTPVLTVTPTGLTVVVDPAGSLPDSGVCAISGYNYDFGDGQTGVGDTVPTNHTYGSSGTYTIELTVTNQGGSGSTSATVTVPPPTPTPIATPTPGATTTPGPSSSPNPSPMATPTSAPTATPTASATPSPTPTASTCSTATPGFTFTTSSHGSTGHADFTDQSTYPTGCPITQWLWNFGDGTPLSNAQNPAHDFADKNATYTVTLTVTNVAGTQSISKSVKPK